MPEDNDKILPKDFDSDYSLPGRFEEGNSEYFDAESVKSKPKNREILVIAVAFVIVSSGFFSYYFMNQNEIDSQIIQNTINVDPEKKLVNQYGVGEYGSDHAHAAIAVFVDGEQLNFGMPQFQLSSRYIHLENHNPYLIHKHATGVPLEMLFASFGMKITSDCIILSYDESTDIKTGRFCTGQDQSLVFYVNGEEYYSDISQYVLEHNDRILVSFGDAESISKHLAYLESLEIFDIPKKTLPDSGNEIFI
ncbi:MAG: hypothetical protein NPMRTH5_1290002 [Nitrosopumilales archaeon]|nr:MAG: hypothetical protein NPMRTH5_1290002 [Nitrosopumilales archaeon]